MKHKLGWSIGLGAVCLSFLGYYQITHSPSENEKLVAKFMKTEIVSLKDFSKGIEWGNTKRNKKFLNNLAFSDELTYQEIRKLVFIPLEKDIFTNPGSNFSKYFKYGEKNVFGIDSTPTLADNKDGIQRFKWKMEFPYTANETTFTNYINTFSQVDDFRIDIKNYYVDMSDRKAIDSNYVKIKLMGYLDLRGKVGKTERRQDVGQISITVEMVNKEWKIAEMVFHNFSTVTSNRSPAFLDITSNVFAENTPGVHLRREAIRRGGYALALSDVNQDGFLDMYVGSAKESEMWIFDPAKKQYLRKMQDAFSQEKMVKTAVFADFDNDQDEDLFVTSFNPFPGPNQSFDELVLYENVNGVFKKITDPNKGVRKDTSYYPMPAVVGDFNNDGLTDIYVGFPGKKDFTFTNLSNGKVVGGKKDVQGLFLNQGNLTFGKSDLFFPEMNQGHRQYLYPHSALAIDWNKDHKMDIVVIDDQMNLSPFYLNKGNAIFEQVADKIGIGDTSNAMSIAAGDFNNDGLVDFAISAVNIDAALRNENAMTNLWHRVEDKYLSGIGGAGVRLFQQTKNGNFVEVTKDAGLDYVGQGVAGIEFVDYNNDGLADLYVTNGLWSGNDRYQDADHLLAAYKILNPRADATLKDKATETGTVSEFMAFLIDFRGDLFAPKFGGTKSVSVAGYQRNKLFRNNGDGTFTDVGYLEGADSINDGYVVAMADLDKDGKTDFILRNGDPGQKEYIFPSVQVFHNTMNWEGKAIDLALKNSKGSDAYGVGVTLEYNGFKQYKQLVSNNGAAQGERILHFGIGNRNAVEKMTIHWTTGDKVYNNIKPGRYEYSEITNILTQK